MRIGMGLGICGPGPATASLVLGGNSASDPYAAYYLYDTFIDTNGVSLASHTPEKGGPWATFGGAFSWTVQSNQARPGTNGGAEGGIVAETSHADVTITVDLPAIQASYQGITFNYVDANNFWWYGPSTNNGVWFLFKRVAGAVTAVAGDNGLVPTGGSSGTIQVITAGDSVTCKRNGVTSITTSPGNRENKTGTKHGLYTGYSAATQIFDNITVGP